MYRVAMHYANPCVYSVADRYRIVALRNRKHMASLCLILSGSGVNLGHLMGRVLGFFFLPIACHILDDAQPPRQKNILKCLGCLCQWEFCQLIKMVHFGPSSVRNKLYFLSNVKLKWINIIKLKPILVAVWKFQRCGTRDRPSFQCKMCRAIFNGKWRAEIEDWNNNRLIAFIFWCVV